MLLCDLIEVFSFENLNKIIRCFFQLYWLKIEIKEQQRRLEELEAIAASCTSRITDVSITSCRDDKIAGCVAEMVELKGFIADNIKKCVEELTKLNHYIDGIEDSEIRTILKIRYVDRLKWSQIMMVVGGGNTADGLRMKHNRFFDKL